MHLSTDYTITRPDDGRVLKPWLVSRKTGEPVVWCATRQEARDWRLTFDECGEEALARGYP